MSAFGENYQPISSNNRRKNANMCSDQMSFQFQQEEEEEKSNFDNVEDDENNVINGDEGEALEGDCLTEVTTVFQNFEVKDVS